MAFSISRAAGTVLGRRAAPAVSTVLSGFRGTATRESVRISSLMNNKIADQLKPLSVTEMMYARSWLESSLTEAGYPYSKDTQIARLEGVVTKHGQRLDQQLDVLNELKSRKGDLASINVGKRGTLNVIAVTMLVLKIDEICPFIQPAVEMIKPFFGVRQVKAVIIGRFWESSVYCPYDMGIIRRHI